MIDLPDSITIKAGVNVTFLHGQKHSGRMTIDAGTEFTIPTHVHLSYDEFFTVESGELLVWLNGVEHHVRPEDGEVKIARGVYHSFLKKADWGQTVFVERTVSVLPSYSELLPTHALTLKEPADSKKEVAFRNMFNYKGGSRALTGLAAVYGADSYPSLPGQIMPIQKALVYFVGGWVAPMLGYKKEITQEDVDAWHEKKKRERI